MKIFNTIACGVAVAMAAISCSDITETQKEFLDRGEGNYVGVLDSVKVHGGQGRVKIVGKQTYLRNVEKFNVAWETMDGEMTEATYNMSDVKEGNSVVIPVNDLAEGDYTFYIRSIDQWGNSSLPVEIPGTSYGETYLKSQSKCAILKVSGVEGQGHLLSISTSSNTVDCTLKYTTKSGEEKEVIVEDFSQDYMVTDWEDKDGSQMSLTTRILPKEKLGLDTLTMETFVQTIRVSKADFRLSGDDLHWMKLTEKDANGKDFGARGENALFDNDKGTQFWVEGRRVPCHFCFDMTYPRLLKRVHVTGRDGYPGWDPVKFEVWGRESIEDGPDGETGYKIQADSQDANFVEEAQRRGWKKVGNGWFIYPNPRSNPQRTTAELTEVDHSFKPRYILFRVMSTLTPDVVPVPDDKYHGDDGGYNVFDGINGKNRGVNIGDLAFEASGVIYTLE